MKDRFPSASRRAFVSGAVGLAACRKQRIEPRQGEPQSLTSMLESNRRKFNVPAMAATVLDASHVLECEAVGVLRRGDSSPVQRSSRFHLGSNTKAITATMVATLVEAKRLTWETTVLNVFPEWKDSMHSEYRRINLNDLFQHYAGLPQLNNAMSRDMRRLPSDRPRDEVARFILQQPPAALPGSTSLYSTPVRRLQLSWRSGSPAPLGRNLSSSASSGHSISQAGSDGPTPLTLCSRPVTFPPGSARSEPLRF